MLPHALEDEPAASEGSRVSYDTATTFGDCSFPLTPPLRSQTFYSAIIDLCDNGGKRPPSSTGVSFTKEQADAIRRIRNSKDSWDMLGVKPGATR